MNQLPGLQFEPFGGLPSSYRSQVASRKFLVSRFLLKEQKGNQREKKDPHQLPGPFLSTLQYVLSPSASLRKEELSLFCGEPPGQKG